MKKILQTPLFAFAAVGTALTALTACERGVTDPDPHAGIAMVEIMDRGVVGRPVVATFTDGQGWEGALPVLDMAETARLSLGVNIYDHAGNQLVGQGGEYTARYMVDPAAPAGIIDMGRDDIFHGDHVHIYPLQPGTTQIRFVLWHIDHDDGNTPPIDLVVIDE